MLSQGFCRALHLRQEGGFRNKSCCVPAVPADKAAIAVPASGACSKAVWERSSGDTALRDTE